MPDPAELSRRDLIAAVSAVGAAAALGISSKASAAPVAASGRAPTVARTAAERSVARAAMTKPHGGDLGAVEHIVFLMMENRSYDHYFGAYHKGRGFDDHPKHSLRSFAQSYPAGTALSPRRKLLPFHLSADAGEDCTHDLSHDWGPQHECWNHGRMDRFVVTHTGKALEGVPDGALTMGYFARRELPLYWALADHFTLLDGYHCSVLGPTHPNRLMSLTGTIDPAGHHGGPITDTSPDPTLRWSCDWPTVPEILEDHGVSWKVYHPSFLDAAPKRLNLAQYPTWDPVLYNPNLNPIVMLATDNVLPYFRTFEKSGTPLHHKAFDPTFPGQFGRDVRRGQLPSVSWIIPPLGFDDHPSTSPERGQWFVQLVLDALTANPKVWSKTVLFLMYDENDGWFDHVPPPTPSRHAAGEWLTAAKISSKTYGIRGPVGLGMRVPAIMISPFSRGGHVVSTTYDHTSQLRLLEERFGIRVPAISHWRRITVGDLTHALFRGHHDASMPALPRVKQTPFTLSGSCSDVNQETNFGGASPALPTRQRMPTQHGTTVAASRYFKPAETAQAAVPLRSGRSTATEKSRHNALAEGRRAG
ncbi:MAG TPA: alkaline phosphatase family protein [Mycobacteriales bacterium]|nr:alkaline phosphatase family protein [Mycobacteriales bacterium]